jgi:L-threonylcarbamoyladenylate synthase
MQIIKAKKLSAAQLQKVVAVLKAGGTIIYPTDTAYGLGGDATNKNTVKRIFLIKHRKEVNPLPNICADLKMAKQYGSFSPLALSLAEKYWPGALNLVVAVKAGKKIATAKGGQVGLRVPNYGLALQITQALKKPLISTSANLSGQPPCYNVKEILQQLEGQQSLPDLLIDAGTLNRRNPPSTVAAVKRHQLVIHRQGKVIINLDR